MMVRSMPVSMKQATHAPDVFTNVTRVISARREPQRLTVPHE